MPRRPNNVDPRYAQRIDPRTGLTEIEAVMRQDEPKPPPPRVPKPQINFPLPWKNKGDKTQSASATAMRQLYQEAHNGQKRKKGALEDFDRGFEGPTDAAVATGRDRTRGLVVDSNVGSLEHGMAEQRHTDQLYTYANDRVDSSSHFRRENSSGQLMRRFNKASAPLLGQVEPYYVPPQGMGKAQILTTIPPPHTSAEAKRKSTMPREFSGSTFGTTNENVVVPHPASATLFGLGDSYNAAHYDHERREEQRRAALAAVNQLQDSQLPQGYNPITGARSAGFSGLRDAKAIVSSAKEGRNTTERSAAGVGRRGGERTEPTTDIFGNPTAESKFTPEHLNFMNERRDAMDRAAREDEARREYDHYGKVMKRTVLVDEARRLRERAEHEMSHSVRNDFAETATTGSTHFRNAQRQPTSAMNGRGVFADPNANANTDGDTEAPLDIFGNHMRRKAVNVTSRGAQEDTFRFNTASRPAALAAEGKENNKASGNLRVVGAEHPLVPRVMQDRNRAIAEAQRGHSPATYGGVSSAPPYAVDDSYYRAQYQTSSSDRRPTAAASGVMPDFLIKPSATSYAAPNVFTSSQNNFNNGGGRHSGQGQLRGGGLDEVAEGEEQAFAAFDRARTGSRQQGRGEPDHQLEKSAEAFFRTSLGRKLVAAAKGWGVANLRTILKEMDKDADGVLSRSEFKQSIIKFGCELSADELSTLMRLAPVTSGTYASAQAAEGKFSMNLDSFFEKDTDGRPPAGSASRSRANRASTTAHDEHPHSLARQPTTALKTIPDPLPAMVVIEPLLHFLRRGRRSPSPVESCLRQCYRTIARKAGGLVSGEAQAKASHTQHVHNTARVRAASSAPRPPSNVTTFGHTEQAEKDTSRQGLRFDQIKSSTNFTAHSSYETCVQGSLRKVSLAFSNAWGPKVLADTIVTEDMFVDFWTDVRMSSYNNSDFIKMLQAMYSSVGRG